MPTVRENLEAIKALVDETLPLLDAEPEQPAPTPVPDVSAIVQVTNNSGGEWEKGVSKQVTRILIPSNAETRRAAVVGAMATFADGSKRRVIDVASDSRNLYPKFEGPKLDPDKVGHPKTVTFTADAPSESGETEQPAPEPEPVRPPAGDLPIAGMCVAGLGNNPWLASINGLGKDKLGTHYRDVEEKTIVQYVKDLKDGESWIARIDVALERFIDNSNMPLNDKYVGEVRRAMDLIHKYRGRVIIDVHNYMRYWKRVDQPVNGRQNASHNDHLAKGHAVWTIIGAPDCPITVEGFADFWKRMAQTFGAHPALLGYGLSNEPHETKYDNLDVHAIWPQVAQACINAIRPVDNKTHIMVGGNFWSSAKMWPTVSTALGKLHDPSNRIVFEAHQYMDKKGDGGGRWESQTDPVVADQAVRDWARWFKWLEDGNHMGYCGEIGGPATAGQHNKALENIFAEFYKRRIPFTQWRAGAGFEDQYANGMNRRDGSLKDNAKPLMKYLGKTVEAYGPRK